MPTVLRAHGLRFMIFVGDHPPPHVHAIGDGSAKIALDGPAARVMENKGLSKADVKRALDAVEVERTRLLRIWKSIHG